MNATLKLLPRLVIVLHTAKLSERIPIVLRAFSCAPASVDVIFQVKKTEMERCRQLTIKGGSPIRRCVAEQSWPQMQHANLVQHLSGRHDLVFAHADMWVQLSALSKRVGLGRGSQGMLRTAFTPKQGISTGQPKMGVGHGPRLEAGPVCLQTPALLNCSVLNVTCGQAFRNQTCMLHSCHGYDPGDRSSARQHLWPWWMNSLATSYAAARKLGVREVCYGWVDLLFLPAAAHAAFRRLAREFGDTFHEVAIPTILNQLQHEPDGNAVHWKPALQCLGSCCDGVPWTPKTERSECAHKIALPSRPSLSCAPVVW